jgi:hypothetical protein
MGFGRLVIADQDSIPVLSFPLEGRVCWDLSFSLTSHTQSSVRPAVAANLKSLTDALASVAAGRFFQRTTEQGRIGVANGYFFVGREVKGINALARFRFSKVAALENIDITGFTATSPIALASSEFAEGGEQAVDFSGGVVMDEADAEDAAVLFDAETFGEIEGIKIAVPGEDAAMAEESGGIGGSPFGEAEGYGGTALFEAFCISDAEEAQAGKGEQPFDESSD